MIGIPATKENCTFKSSGQYNVYAYKGVESVSTTEAAPKKTTSNTITSK